MFLLNDLGVFSIFQIAEKHRKRAEKWSHTAHTKITINELETFWPDIKWLKLIKIIAGNQASGTDYIIFDILDYIKDLVQFIMGTPKR